MKNIRKQLIYELKRRLRETVELDCEIFDTHEVELIVSLLLMYEKKHTGF